MASFFGGSLRLALKQSLAETGHLAAQQKEKERRQREEEERRRKDRRKKQRAREQREEVKRRQQQAAAAASRKAQIQNLAAHAHQQDKESVSSHGASGTKIHISTAHGKSGNSRRRSISSSSLSSSNSSESESDDTASNSSSDNNDDRSFSSKSGNKSDTNIASLKVDSTSTDECELGDELDDTDEESDRENLSKKCKNKSTQPVHGALKKINAEKRRKSSLNSNGSSSKRSPKITSTVPKTGKKRKRENDQASLSSVSHTQRQQKITSRCKESFLSKRSKKASDILAPNMTDNIDKKKTGRVRTVSAPAPEIMSWVHNMSDGKQRKNIAVGLRVKVRFDMGAKKLKKSKDDKVAKRFKWYGGVVSEVSSGGRRIRIIYDDGTSEVADFPDKDIVVDSENNGKHGVNAEIFFPPPPSSVEVKTEVSTLSRAVSPVPSTAFDCGHKGKEKNKKRKAQYQHLEKEEEPPLQFDQKTPTKTKESKSCEQRENGTRTQGSAVLEVQHASSQTSTTSNKASTVTESSFSLPSSGCSSGVNDSSESSYSSRSFNYEAISIKERRDSGDSMDFDDRNQLYDGQSNEQDSSSESMANSDIPRISISNTPQQNTCSPHSHENESLRVEGPKTSTKSTPSLTIKIIPPKALKEGNKESTNSRQKISHLDSSEDSHDCDTQRLFSDPSRTSLCHSSFLDTQCIHDGISISRNVSPKLSIQNDQQLLDKNMSANSKSKSKNMKSLSKKRKSSAWKGADPELPKKTISGLEFCDENFERNNQIRTETNEIDMKHSLGTKDSTKTNQPNPFECTNSLSLQKSQFADNNVFIKKEFVSKNPSFKDEATVSLAIVRSTNQDDCMNCGNTSEETTKASHTLSNLKSQNKNSAIYHDNDILPTGFSKKDKRKKEQSAIKGTCSEFDESPKKVKRSLLTGPDDSSTSMKHKATSSEMLESAPVSKATTGNSKSERRGMTITNKHASRPTSGVDSASSPDVAVDDVNSSHENVLPIIVDSTISETISQPTFEEESLSSPEHASSFESTSGGDGIGAKMALVSSARSTRLAAQKANERIAAKEVVIVDEYVVPKKKREKLDLELFPYPPTEGNTISNNLLNINQEIIESEQERWVQCDRCMKWRLLPSTVQMDQLPERWYCELNTYDLKRNSCDAPEQTAEEIANEKSSTANITYASNNLSSNDIESELPENGLGLDGTCKIEKSLSPLQSDPSSVIVSVSEKQTTTHDQNPNIADTRNLPESDRDFNQVGEMPSVQPQSVCNPTDSFQISSIRADSLNTTQKGDPVKKNSPSPPLDDALVNINTNAVDAANSSDVNDSATEALDSSSTIKTKGCVRGRNRPRGSKDADREKSVKGGKQQQKGVFENQEWVQCEKCEKWRKLPPCILSEELPEKWYCSMNTWDVNSAFCEAEEDKVETNIRECTILNGSAAISSASIGFGKLSYRNLIFGTSRKHIRPTSERARAADSLFASHSRDQPLEGSGPPTFLYANSSAFRSKQATTKNQKTHTSNNGRKSFLDLMSKSKLWSELYGANISAATNQAMERRASNSLCRESQRVVSNKTDNVSSNLSEASQSEHSNLIRNIENNHSLKDLIHHSLGIKILSVCDIFLECQTHQQDIDVGNEWESLQATCTLELIILALDELVKDGLVEVIRGQLPGETCIDQNTIRYRGITNGVNENSLTDFPVTKRSRCMKISKPWKAAGLIQRNCRQDVGYDVLQNAKL